MDAVLGSVSKLRIDKEIDNKKCLQQQRAEDGLGNSYNR